MPEPAEATSAELVEFAASLLERLPPRLRERDVLEDAVRQHRETWLMLYKAAAALKSIAPSG